MQVVGGGELIGLFRVGGGAWGGGVDAGGVDAEGVDGRGGCD